MKENIYYPPEVEIIYVGVEKGFSLSNETEFVEIEKGTWD